ncbi:YetF domain-containing protein [Acinetobacter pollinis]|nr:YetF domain-containing protein [Acinetobacter pollinis]
MPISFYVFLLIKIVISFTVIISYMNFIGKTQLTQFTAVDFFGNFIFGAVVGGSIYNGDLEITGFTIMLLMSVGFMLFLNYLSHHILRIRAVTIGESIPVIKHGKFLLDKIEQKRRKIDMLRILSQLQCLGFSSFQEVYYAEIQPDGQLAAIKDKPVLPSEIIILRGVFFDTLIDEQEIDKERLELLLETNRIDVSAIFLAEYYEDKIFITFNDGSEKTLESYSIKK